MEVIGVIPCRYKSSRFPGKAIAPICGKPMLWHVWNQAKKTKYVDKLIVATDDNRIYDVCYQYGIESIMTSEDHNTGTDRVAEVAERIEGDIPRKYKEPCFIGIKGLCCVTHPEFVREGSLLGERIGIYEVNNPYSPIEVRGEEEVRMAEKLIECWIEN